MLLKWTNIEDLFWPYLLFENKKDEAKGITYNTHRQNLFKCNNKKLQHSNKILLLRPVTSWRICTAAEAWKYFLLCHTIYLHSVVVVCTTQAKKKLFWMPITFLWQRVVAPSPSIYDNNVDLKKMLGDIFSSQVKNTQLRLLRQLFKNETI